MALQSPGSVALVFHIASRPIRSITERFQSSAVLPSIINKRSIRQININSCRRIVKRVRIALFPLRSWKRQGRAKRWRRATAKSRAGCCWLHTRCIELMVYIDSYRYVLKIVLKSNESSVWTKCISRDYDWSLNKSVDTLFLFYLSLSFHIAFFLKKWQVKKISLPFLKSDNSKKKNKYK